MIHDRNPADLVIHFSPLFREIRIVSRMILFPAIETRIVRYYRCSLPLSNIFFSFRNSFRKFDMQGRLLCLARKQRSRGYWRGEGIKAVGGVEINRSRTNALSKENANASINLKLVRLKKCACGCAHARVTILSSFFSASSSPHLTLFSFRELRK